jgi:hypothetical protein
MCASELALSNSSGVMSGTKILGSERIKNPSCYNAAIAQLVTHVFLFGWHPRGSGFNPVMCHFVFWSFCDIAGGLCRA